MKTYPAGHIATITPIADTPPPASARYPLGFLVDVSTEEVEDASPSRMPDGRTVAGKHRTGTVDL